MCPLMQVPSDLRKRAFFSFLFICTSLPFFVFGFFGSGKLGWALRFNWSFLLGEWDGVGVIFCLRA